MTTAAYYHHYPTMSLFSPPSSPTTTSPYNLRKRRAEVEPPLDSPLAKRFRKLNLREPSKVTKRPSAGSYNNSSSAIGGSSVEEQWNLTPPPFQRASSPPPAVMEVDDTPYKIYVNDLDSSSDEDRDSPRRGDTKNPIIFLSDVEREMSRIPIAVLNASPASSSPSNPAVTKLTTARSESGSSMDLILYRPPEKVVDDDGVRRFILEAKERMRSSRRSTMDGVKSTSQETAGAAGIMMGQSAGQLGGGFTASPMSFLNTMMPNNDPDAMVLDDL